MPILIRKMPNKNCYRRPKGGMLGDMTTDEMSKIVNDPSPTNVISQTIKSYMGDSLLPDERLDLSSRHRLNNAYRLGLPDVIVRQDLFNALEKYVEISEDRRMDIETKIAEKNAIKEGLPYYFQRLRNPTDYEKRLKNKQYPFGGEDISKLRKYYYQNTELIDEDKMRRTAPPILNIGRNI